MPKFEDRTAGTFQEIVLHGKAVAIREGKLGTAGTVGVTSYPTPAAARRAYDRWLDAKRDEADDGDEPADNAELLAQIAMHPGDDALRMVYADWLQANGNPRGELIALQAKRDKKLQAKAKRLIDRHPEWMGSIGEHLKILSKFEARNLRLDWHLGFLRKVELRSNLIAPDLVFALARLPSARFVQELVLGGTDNYRRVVTTLADTGWPASIEKLSIGHQRWGEYLPTANHCGEIVAVIKKYPRLSELDITPGGSKLGRIVAPAIRRLTLRDVTPHQLLAIAAAKWPALERLGLRLIEARYIATALDLKLVAPKLRELDLHVWRDDQVQALVAKLPKAKLLAGIERIRLIADKHHIKQLKAALPKLAIEQADDEADL